MNRTHLLTIVDTPGMVLHTALVSYLAEESAVHILEHLSTANLMDMDANIMAFGPEKAIMRESFKMVCHMATENGLMALTTI